MVVLKASNLIGVDVDGLAGRLMLDELGIRLPRTIAVRSGRADHGWHAWFRAGAGMQKHKIQFATLLQMSVDGYLVCPPAFHARAEREYEFILAPWETPLAPFPPALYARLLQITGDKDHEARADDHSPIHEGERHAHLLRVGGAMRRAGAGAQAILAALRVENQLRCSPPKTDRQLSSLAYDLAHRYPPGHEGAFDVEDRL